MADRTARSPAGPVRQHDPDDRPALDVLEGMLDTIRTAATNPGWFTGGERGARFYLIDALARAERAARRLREEQRARDGVWWRACIRRLKRGRP